MCKTVSKMDKNVTETNTENSSIDISYDLMNCSRMFSPTKCKVRL